MSTVLTDEQIDAIFDAEADKIYRSDVCKLFGLARAIEQAVLQSDEIQELRETLSLVFDLAGQEWMDQNGKRMAAVGNDGNRFWFITEDVMSAVRAAMEKQP